MTKAGFVERSVVKTGNWYPVSFFASGHKVFVETNFRGPVVGSRFRGPFFLLPARFTDIHASC